MTPPPPPPPRGRGRAGDDDLEHVLRRSRRRRDRTRGKRKRRTTLIFVVLLVIVLAVIASSVGAVARFRSDCDLKELKAVQIGENSFVYAANGSLLGAIPAERNRTPVALWRVSPWMGKATVAIEDHRFYEHGGVDYEGIARAAWKDLSAGHVVQGGSTITQQLVRNLYISKERTLKRKLKEACLAIRLSRARSKDWILGQYMNQVYYGNHAYGIEAAAETYFSKDARDLNLAESALLAGLPQAPSVYDPLHRPGAARERRDEVLRAMRDYGDINEARYLHAVAQKNLKLKPGKLYTRIREPYFFSYVRDQLIDEYGANTVRSGGLRVYTTINPRLQVAARKAITDTLYLRNDPAAAVVSINPASGAIRAMTAVTPGRTGNQFNLVAQARRQPGSTFKTFVLTAAINEGMNPDSTYYTSAPFHYQPDPYTPAWDVQTYDHSYSGSISVHSATLASDNTVYAQLTLDVGPDKVAEMAHKLGIRSHLDVVPAMGLGADAISPLEEASAYATLAAGGIYSKPMAIRKVVLANGKEDTDAGWGKPQRQRVISDGVAYEVTKILEDNVLGGTGVGAYFGRPAAGKTGTTDNHADAWFSGYVPQLETTVWVGYPQGEIPMLRTCTGSRLQGGTFPATIWKLFMETAMDGTPALSWAYPRDPVVWEPFTQGQYGSSLRPTTTYYSPTTTSGTTTTRSTTTTTATTTTGRTVITTTPPAPPPPPEPPPPPPPVPPPPPPPVPPPPPPPAPVGSRETGAARRARRDPGLPRRLRRARRRPRPRGSLPRRPRLPGVRGAAACTGRCPTATSSSSTRRGVRGLPAADGARRRPLQRALQDADGPLRRRDARAGRARAGRARRVADADPRRRGAAGPLADRPRADLAQHLRRLAGLLDRARALAAAARLGATGVRGARAGDQREGLSARARAARRLVRLAPRGLEADGARARRARAGGGGGDRAVRGLRAARRLRELPLAGRARPAGREPRRLAAARARPARRLPRAGRRDDRCGRPQPDRRDGRRGRRGAARARGRRGRHRLVPLRAPRRAPRPAAARLRCCRRRLPGLHEGLLAAVPRLAAAARGRGRRRGRDRADGNRGRARADLVLPLRGALPRSSGRSGCCSPAT